MELSNQIITHEMKRVFNKNKLNGGYHVALPLVKALIGYFRDQHIDDMEDLQNSLDSLADQLKAVNKVLAESTINHDILQKAIAAWYLEGYAVAEYNPHNYKPYIFDGKFWGLGSCCQEALDYAINMGQFDEFLVDPEEVEDVEHLLCGGNASEYFEYDLYWAEEIF